MNTQITKEEFEALAAIHSVVVENDIEYSYENIVDAEGNELAFACYSNKIGHVATYTLRGED